jgi:hypothetical protein
MDIIAEKYPNVFLTQPLVNLLDCEVPKSKFRVVAQLSPQPQIVRDNDLHITQDDGGEQPILSAESQRENQIGIPGENSDYQPFAAGFDAWNSDLIELLSGGV